MRLRRELFPPSLIILRANPATGVKRMTLKRMRLSCAPSVFVENSQIVNSHHEKAKRWVIRADLGKALAIRGFFKTEQSANSND